MGDVLRQKAPYLDDHFKLERNLGPSIDIGPAIMAKIIKENVQVYISLHTKH